MADSASIGLALAFSAGLLSFLSPCVLLLIPSYLTFVTGVGFDELGTARRAALVHALLFVLGFTLIFVALGASATVLGRLLGAYRIWITRAGGALIIVFGLYLLGVARIGALDRDRRVHLANKPVGYLGSVLVGVAFGLALPFLIAAVAVERFLEAVTRLRPYLSRVSRISGALLVVVGLLMVFDYFTAMATYFQTFTPAALRNRI